MKSQSRILLFWRKKIVEILFLPKNKNVSHGHSNINGCVNKYARAEYENMVFFGYENNVFW